MAGLATSPLNRLRTPYPTAGTGTGLRPGTMGTPPPANTGGQTLDPYGRLTTTQNGGTKGGPTVNPDGTVGYANPTGGFGNITIETPPGGYGGGGGGTTPRTALPPTTTGAPPSDTGAPPLDENTILNILNKLKPEAPPPRELPPTALPREVAPTPTASPAAKSQGFARAKDNAGRIANAAMRSLRSEMVSRGIEGSGVEGQLASNILGESARGIADASFEQERAAEDQAWQAAQLGYQGAISQRANDMGLVGTGYGGGVTQRGQDINAQPNMLALAPTILGLLSRRY